MFLLKITENCKKLEDMVVEQKNSFGKGSVLSLFETWERKPKRLEEIEEALGYHYSISEITDLSLRLSSDDLEGVFSECKDLCNLGKAIFKASFSTSLKTAIYHDLNIIGYLFDRSEDNYRICYEPLRDFLWALLYFKKELTTIELERWNASTVCGTTIDHQFEILRTTINLIMDFKS